MFQYSSKIVPFFEIFLEKYGRALQATADNMAHAHCMLGNEGYSHTEYVILTPFSLQQWLHERASLLRYTCIACFVIFTNSKVSDIDYWDVSRRFLIQRCD